MTDALELPHGVAPQRNCLVCGGPFAGDPEHGRAACRDCGALHDTEEWVAPLPDSRPPTLPAFVMPEDAKVTVDPHDTGTAAVSPYRSPAAQHGGPFIARWRNHSPAKAAGFVGVCLVGLVAWVATMPLASIFFGPLFVLAAYVAIARATEHYELRAGDGTIELVRSGLPGPKGLLSWPHENALNNEPPQGEVTTQAIPATRPQHVAIFARPISPTEGLIYYGVRVINDRGETHDYAVSTDLAMTRLVYRMLRGEMPALAGAPSVPALPATRDLADAG